MSYDSETWELRLFVHGDIYLYLDVSPHHADKVQGLNTFKRFKYLKPWETEGKMEKE